MSASDQKTGYVAPITRMALLTRVAESSLAQRVEPQSVVAEVAFTPPSDSGRKYRIIVTGEMDEYDEPMALSAMLVTTRATLRRVGDSFQGTARRPAKLSIPNAPVEVFPDLQDLLASLPSDASMINRQPMITTDKKSKRIAEEQRNVRLRVWLYAASREEDNDFHLILGREPGLTPEVFMTMELSGLPRSNSKHFARLKAARDAYKGFFGSNMPGGTYHHYDPPIPTEIEGGLFFDMSHSTGGRPGPKKLRDRMPVIWEVHPISEIVFEP